MTQTHLQLRRRARSSRARPLLSPTSNLSLRKATSGSSLSSRCRMSCVTDNLESSRRAPSGSVERSSVAASTKGQRDRWSPRCSRPYRRRREVSSRPMPPRSRLAGNAIRTSRLARGSSCVRRHEVDADRSRCIPGNDWIDTALYFDGESVSFELWAETEDLAGDLTEIDVSLVTYGRLDWLLRTSKRRVRGMKRLRHVPIGCPSEIAEIGRGDCDGDRHRGAP